ncbi:DUF192 domain-containing protein [Antarcticibacterium arcticum]|uniref:DUF192 domain-containing protein n=1 Tax=Antarcticibacterium arcticum TaxID=2585771 RepID=A0A5B8YLN9_9FLAO|nr:DUF192 domain-containing protein [Antarcticibacterium arcticum]QED38920.1 DUF192 domain-containing protein [Antarcticibacterium arcticum]
MRKCIKGIFIFSLTTGMLFSCANEPKESSIETEEILFTKEGELSFLKGGEVERTIDIEIADTPYERETGLMYRKSLGENQGMLFIYSNEASRSFYMKNTYIPLDLIFYNKDSIVVSFHENAVPLTETSIPSNFPAQFILELNAGKVEEWNIETGDKIRFTRD